MMSNLGIICYETFKSVFCLLLLRQCLETKEYQDDLGG